MTPGPTQILKIARTGTLVKIATINSGNTFGARYWTDGWREAPMLPDEPALRRHPESGELFWPEEGAVVGVEEGLGSGSGPSFAEVPYAETPDLDDYRRMLDTEPGLVPGQRRYLLMRYWWAANDPIRHGEATASPPVDFRRRLAEFRTLLDLENPNRRLMAAEVARQLGDFSTATDLLDFPFPRDYSKAVALIRQLAESQETMLRELT